MTMNEDVIFLYEIFSSYQRTLQSDVKKKLISKASYETKLNKMRNFRDNFVHQLKK